MFRALELFEELGLVERIDLPNGEHAYVVCQPAHHHHVVCTRCGRSAEVDDLGMEPIAQRSIADRLLRRLASRRAVRALSRTAASGRRRSASTEPPAPAVRSVAAPHQRGATRATRLRLNLRPVRI